MFFCGSWAAELPPSTVFPIRSGSPGGIPRPRSLRRSSRISKSPLVPAAPMSLLASWDREGEKSEPDDREFTFDVITFVPWELLHRSSSKPTQTENFPWHMFAFKTMSLCMFLSGGKLHIIQHIYALHKIWQPNYNVENQTNLCASCFNAALMQINRGTLISGIALVCK